MGKSQRWKLLVIPAAVLCLIAVAACGGSSSSSSSSSTTAETSTEAQSEPPASSPAGSESEATGAPFKIGNISTCTGPASTPLAGACPTIEAWAKWTNTHGGINGHPVELILEDDGSEPAQAQAAARKLVSDHVMAIVGEYSAIDSSWAKIADEAEIPVIGGLSTNATFLEDPNFYASGAQITPVLYGLLEEAKNAGTNKLGVYYCAEVPVCAGLAGTLEAIAPVVGGVEVVESGKVSQTQPSYTAPCLAAKGSGANALFLGLDAQTGQRMADACAQQGFMVKQFGTTGTMSEQLAQDPSFEESITILSNVAISNETLPAAKEMHEALEQYASSLNKESPQYNNQIPNVWSSGLLFKAVSEVAKLTPESTAADVKKGLYSLKEETLEGFSGPITYTEGQPNLLPCYFIQGVENGELSEPSGDEPICIPPAKVEAMGKALAG